MADTALPRTTAAIAEGFERGWHVGFQLAAWRNGAPVASLAQGQASDKAPMTDESLMPWFSATKIATGLAVVQLCDRGQLDLDQTVASVLPAFAAGGKEGVTVRHVLTHTGGFRYVAGGDDGYARGLSPAELLDAVNAAPLEPGWVPGERAGYHPVTGFHVLGDIVRVIDGRPFDAYVSEEIFERLGMADSWMALTPERAADYGERLVQMHDTTVDPPRVLPRFTRPDGWVDVFPSGSGVGPMGDLVRLVEALRQGGALDGERVLSEEATASMRSRHRQGVTDETFGWVIDWGLGLMLNSWHYRSMPTPYGYGEHASDKAFGHGAMQSGVTFSDPAHGLSVALAFNGMPGEAKNHRRTQPVVTALYEDLTLAREPRPVS